MKKKRENTSCCTAYLTSNQGVIEFYYSLVKPCKNLKALRLVIRSEAAWVKILVKSHKHSQTAEQWAKQYPLPFKMSRTNPSVKTDSDYRYVYNKTDVTS